MPDPVYVAARRILLDALQALGKHRDAVVLVGAQAIYLQAGDADLEVTVAPFTTDALAPAYVDALLAAYRQPPATAAPAA